ncbi:MAG: TRZ/ATZ family hydrolase [Sulfuricellaceae bacterium]|jgi:5-methylthioadenosine/S-adenosylhomocysteine deaminase
MSPLTTIDTLIDARWVVPVEPELTVLSRHSLAIREGKIVALLPTEEAHLRFKPERHLQLKNHLLIPGLINLHTHAAMTLLRGLADDLPLMDWLHNHIWPAEGRFMSAEFVHDGTLLACAEMLRSGITCFNDMYFYPEAAANAALQAKMRAALGIVTVEFPTPYASDADDYLHKGLAARDAFRDEALISFTLAPHAPYTVSDQTFAKILTYSEQLDLPIHLHLHETHEEVEESLKQYQVRPLERLYHLGLLGPNLIAVHMVQLNKEEIRLLAEHGCHVAHCPTSNLKLASGIGPVVEKLEHDVNVGLGTDGAASNNRLDILAEMRLAALLAKGQSRKASALPAFETLKLATLNAARALRLDHLVGSLKPGKAADIVALDFSGPEMEPCYDPVSHLVYAAGREHVSHVWVNGEMLLSERRLTSLDERDIHAKAVLWQERIRNAA